VTCGNVFEADTSAARIVAFTARPTCQEVGFEGVFLIPGNLKELVNPNLKPFGYIWIFIDSSKNKHFGVTTF